MNGMNLVSTEQQTPNPERRTVRAKAHWMWDVGCSTFDAALTSVQTALALFVCLASQSASAQTTPSPNPNALMNLMQSVPSINTEAPVTATAAFDPPTISAGGNAIYHVRLNALSEAVTKWPEPIPAPSGLDISPGAHGQTLQMASTNLEAITVFNFHVHATNTGSFTIPGFQIQAYGRPVSVPAATLHVVPSGAPMNARELRLETDETNVFVGQSVEIRISLASGRARTIPRLSEVQLNGDGFLEDKESVSQQISPIRQADGTEAASFVYGTTITPFVRGPVKLSAQAFTAGTLFSGQVVINGRVTILGGPPEFDLLESHPLTLHVRPLPVEGQLPGFTGAIGEFTSELPVLSSSVVRVGDPLKLTVTFHGKDNVEHLVMPPPPTRSGWQSFAAVPGAASPNPRRLLVPGRSASFTFTFVPLTEGDEATPEIPFSYFDPKHHRYVDLSIPSVPIKVLPGRAPAGAAAAELESGPSGDEQKPALGALAETPGTVAATLEPLQQRRWFTFVELGPVILFGILWGWDRRRRYLEAHPDMVRRRKARRALRRERRQLRNAARAGDSQRFASGAINALQIASAPHYPAEPRALVCADVLQLLDPAERNNGAGSVVRRFFAETDSVRFAAPPGTNGSLLELQSDLERILEKLEARL